MRVSRRLKSFCVSKETRIILVNNFRSGSPLQVRAIFKVSRATPFTMLIQLWLCCVSKM